MNILFIGNSYTQRNNLEKLFEELCRENGRDVSADRVTVGGRKMIQYTDPENPVTQQLETALKEKHYDVVFLQEQSLQPLLNFDAFAAGMQHVGKMVSVSNPQIILYATWARKVGSPDLETYGWTPDGMTQMLDSAYRKVGESLGAAVSPVGISFSNAIALAPDIELYDPDRYHPSYLGSCLAALTHYATLFGSYPEHTASLSLDERTCAVFRDAVCV